MRTAVCLLLGLALLGLVVPAMAGDIVDMPTGNTVAPKHVEVNLIHWDIENPVGSIDSAQSGGGPPGHIRIYEVFVGIMDRVELDVDIGDIENVDTFTEVNLYLTAIRETPTHPSLIVGATNIFGSDWVNGDDKVSPFVLTSYNANVPKGGPPSFNDPVVRLHLGYGSEYHDGLFGGVQFLFLPCLGAAVLNYQHQPSYMGTVLVGKHVELTYGTKNGDPFYRLGGNFAW